MQMRKKEGIFAVILIGIATQSPFLFLIGLITVLGWRHPISLFLINTIFAFMMRPKWYQRRR